MTFTMTATGAVGSTIDIYPADVASTVVDPENLDSRLDVVCSQIAPAPFLQVLIVAAAPPGRPPPCPAPRSWPRPLSQHPRCRPNRP